MIMQTGRMSKSYGKSLNSSSIKSKLLGLVQVFQNVPSPSFPAISLITLHYHHHHHHPPQKGPLQPNDRYFLFMSDPLPLLFSG